LTLGIFSVVALIVFLVLTKSGGSSSIPSPAQVPTYVQTPAKSTIKTPTQTTTPGQLKPGTKYGYIVTKEAGSRVYLRPGPAKKGGQPVLQDGNRVVVLDTSATKDGTWYYIDYNGQRGFVHSSLLNIPQTTSNAGNVRNNTSSAQTRAAQTTSPAQKNQSASNNQGTASKYVAEGKKQWQLKNWQAAYNAFDQAYKQSPTNEIKTYRENALANLRGEKDEAARQLAFKQAAADAAAAEAARQRTAQELAEKQRQEEEARKLAAKQRQQENTANVIKGILSIGAQLLNK
jgi:hypothetical protein